jgi:hypothetical protein
MDGGSVKPGGLILTLAQVIKDSPSRGVSIKSQKSKNDTGNPVCGLVPAKMRVGG